MAYDAEIRVGTKVDTSQMQKLQIQINKSTDKVKQLTQKMRELKDTEIPTDEYKELQSELEKSEKYADSLYGKLRVMEKAGTVNTAPYKKLREQIRLIDAEIDNTRMSMQELVDSGNAFTLGQDTSKYANLAQQRSYEIANLQALNKRQDELIVKQRNGADGFKKIASSAKKAFTALSGGAKSAFEKVSSVAKKAFGSVNKGTEKTNRLLMTMRSRMRELTLSLLIFNQITRAFNAMVNGAKEGITEFAKYSKDCNAVLSDFKSSLQTMKFNLGAAFAPIVQTIVPYLTAFINALNSVISKISQFFAVLTGKSTYYRAIQQQVDFAGSLEDTANAAKEAAGALAGFDKLNVVKQQEDSGSGGSGGGSGAGGEFEEIPIDNNIKELAEKVKAILAQLFAPLKEAWEREGDFVMESWKSALDEIWLLIKDIGRDFLIVWNQEETIAIFENILRIIGDIGLVVANLTHNFRDAWNENQTGLHILENIRDIFAVIVENIRKAADFTVEWSKGIDFIPLLTKIEEWTESMVPVFDSLSGILSDFYTQVLLPLAEWAIEEGLPDLLQVFIDFNEAVDWEGLRTRLSEFWEHLEPFAETIGEGLITFIGDLSQKIADFTNSETFKKMLEWLEEKMDSTTPEDIAKGIETIAKAFIFFKIASLGLKALTTLAPAVTTIKSLIDIFKGGAGTAAAGAGAKGLAASLSGAYASLGGLSGILTTDLATIFGAGTAAEIGTTLGVGVAGAFMAAIGGFELGKWLGAQIFPEMEEEYKNFHWLGEGGFFDQMKGSINDGSFIGALELWRQDIESWLDENIGEWSSLTWSELFGVKEEEITKAAQSVQGALGGIVTTGLTMSQTLSDTTGKTKEMTDGVSELSTGLSNGKTSLDNYQQGLSDASGTGQEFVNSLDNAFTGMEGFNENAATAGLNAGLSLAKGLQDSKADISTSIAGLSTQIETEGSAMEQQTTVLGGSLIAGFNNGITNNMETTTASLDSWSDAIIKAIHDGPLKFGSPSKKTEEFGKDTVVGYNNGVSGNVAMTISTIRTYMQTIQNTFMNIVSMLSDVGQKAMSALINGLISKQGELKKTVQSMTELIGNATMSSSKISIPVSSTMYTKQTNIPHLATGSVIRGGNPFLAVLGDQPSGQTNIEAPLSTIKQALKEALRENGGNGGEYTFVAQLNGKTLYSETVRQDQMIKKSAGKSRLGN